MKSLDNFQSVGKIAAMERSKNSQDRTFNFQILYLGWQYVV